VLMGLAAMVVVPQTMTGRKERIQEDLPLMIGFFALGFSSIGSNFVNAYSNRWSLGSSDTFKQLLCGTSDAGAAKVEAGAKRVFAVFCIFVFLISGVMFPVRLKAVLSQPETAHLAPVAAYIYVFPVPLMLAVQFATPVVVYAAIQAQADGFPTTTRALLDDKNPLSGSAAITNLNRRCNTVSRAATPTLACVTALIVSGISLMLAVAAGPIVLPTESAVTQAASCGFAFITLAIIPLWLTTTLNIASVRRLHAMMQA
jgi:hypothetical protein